MIGFYKDSEIDEIILVTEVNTKRFINELVKIMKQYVIYDIKYSTTKDNNQLIYSALLLCQKAITQTPPLKEVPLTEERVDESVKEGDK